MVCDGRFLMSLASICYEVIVYLFPRTIFRPVPMDAVCALCHSPLLF